MSLGRLGPGRGPSLNRLVVFAPLLKRARNPSLRPLTARSDRLIARNAFLEGLGPRPCQISWIISILPLLSAGFVGGFISPQINPAHHGRITSAPRSLSAALLILSRSHHVQRDQRSPLNSFIQYCSLIYRHLSNTQLTRSFAQRSAFYDPLVPLRIPDLSRKQSFLRFNLAQYIYHFENALLSIWNDAGRHGHWRCHGWSNSRSSSPTSPREEGVCHTLDLKSSLVTNLLIQCRLVHSRLEKHGH